MEIRGIPCSVVGPGFCFDHSFMNVITTKLTICAGIPKGLAVRVDNFSGSSKIVLTNWAWKPTLFINNHTRRYLWLTHLAHG